MQTRVKTTASKEVLVESHTYSAEDVDDIFIAPAAAFVAVISIIE